MCGKTKWWPLFWLTLIADPPFTYYNILTIPKFGNILKKILEFFLFFCVQFSYFWYSAYALIVTPLIDTLFWVIFFTPLIDTFP